MHCFCAVIHKHKRDVYSLIDNWCDEDYGRWDYASIGGRYSYCIPVGRNSKLIEGYVESVHVLPFGGEIGENPEKNEKCKYVNMAKIRNINLEEVARMKFDYGLSIANPYSYVLIREDDNYEDVDEITNTNDVWQILNMPQYQGWYITAIDYHI